MHSLLQLGAVGGTCTHPPSRITDFESVSSADSDTPASHFIIAINAEKINTLPNENFVHCKKEQIVYNRGMNGSEKN